MLTRDENELLTRVGPGTPAGELMRRYWIPAVMAVELPEPDCAPVRVKLLGEDLLAFRDTSGKVGIIDELCPHRLASLWLGRNEENGLRCVYHGWKFDTDGRCVDQMNEPESFAHKITVKAYPTVEMGGIVWAYMGPTDKQPPVPSFEWTRLAQSQVALTKVLQECNWLQALEGGIDTSHAPILHRALVSPSGSGFQGIDPKSPFVRGKAPKLEVEVTDYGYRYFGIRELGDELYVRGYHYVMPFTQIRPQQFIGDGSKQQGQAAGHFWVPMDDENTMVWNWHYNYDGQSYTEDQRVMRGGGTEGPDTVNWEDGSFRSKWNRENNWGMDREAQRTRIFSGIPAGNLQDRAVQEAMGAIVDRTREHLGPADKAIATTRRLLINTIRALREGKDPVSASDTKYHYARAMEKMLPNDGNWRDRIIPDMYPGHEVVAAETVTS